MYRTSTNEQTQIRNSNAGKKIAFAIVLSGLTAFTAGDVFSQKRVQIVEQMNQVTRFNRNAPVNTIKPVAGNFKLPIDAGNASVNKRIAIRAGQNADVLKAGNAALKNREMIADARKAARNTKLIRRGAMAATGVGLVLVGGVWIAESLIGDSPDEIAIDAVASIAQGRRLDKVAGDIGKRIDPNRLLKNTGRNLNKTGRDISNAFNVIGSELKKIRL